MARRLRCPCGNLVPLPDDAAAGTRIACTACERTLAVPGAKPAAAPAAASKPAAPTSKPAAVKTAAVSKAAPSRPVAAVQKKAVPSGTAKRTTDSDDEIPVRKKKAAPPRGNGLLIGVVLLLLLAGGGVAAWMHFKDKPKPTEQAKDKPKPDDKKDGGKKEEKKEEKKDTKQPTSISFTLTVEQDKAEVSPGAPPAQLTVKALRNKDFTGEIALTFKGLPPEITPVPAGADDSAPITRKLAEKQDELVFQLKLAPTVKLDSYRVLVEGKSKDGDREWKAEASSPTETVVVAPFENLKIEPKTPIVMAQGAETTLTVKVTRKGGYVGPIALKLKGLQAGVGPESFEIPAKESMAVVKLTAATDALLAKRSGEDAVAVIGTLPTAADAQIAMKKFDLEVTAATVKAPFDLTIDPSLVKVTQGGEVVVKAIATRRSYTGPIKVDLVNLPDKVKVASVEIPADKDMADVKFTAEKDAVAKDYTDPPIYATGTTSDAAAKPIQSAPFVLRVVSSTPVVLFEYKLDPSPVLLPQGAMKQMKVTIVRKDYQGPITLDVKGLPDKVTVKATTIDKSETTTTVEFTAAADAVLGDYKSVTLLGMAGESKVESPKFTLSIVKPQSFDLTVTTPVQVRQGTKTSVLVTAKRGGYDGPITVELRNLPKLVTAPNGVIKQGETTVSIDVTADGQAKRGDSPPTVLAVGTASDLGTKEFPSAPFVVTVQGPANFVLSVAPAKVSISQGNAGIVTVTAARIDYDGPIDVALVNLQPPLTAPVKSTIPQGQNSITILITVPVGAPPGDRNNVIAQGSAAAVGIVPSAKFTVSVVGKPAPGGTFTLKADHMKIKKNGTATLTVHVDRKGGYNGAVNIVSWKNQPAGLAFTAFTIAAGQNKGTTTIAAAGNAQLIKHSGVTVHGSTTDGTYQVDSAAFEVDVTK